MNPLPDITLRVDHGVRGDLTAGDIAEMRGLLSRHFEGVDETQFARDLSGKSHVLRVWKGEDLVGFSTLLAYRTEIGDESFNVLYSGDTIMSPACWNSPVLARGWIAMVKGVQASLPAGRCLWLLLSVPTGFLARFLAAMGCGDARRSPCLARCDRPRALW